MGILGKLFGAKPDIEKLRRALEQANYVDALHIGEDLLAAGDANDELDGLIASASDGLARKNLEEAERLLAAGDGARAEEHLYLAREHARDETLRREIEALASADRTVDGATTPVPKSSTAKDCSSCSPVAQPAEDLGILPDEAAHFELLLASYPADIQARYRACSRTFQQALMLINAGEDETASRLLEQLDPAERDDLYQFELGSLRARQGQTAEAQRLLQQALNSAPGNLLALDALLAVQESPEAARKLLQAQLQQGADPAYCQARLCEISAQERNYPAALELARQALSAGYAAPEFLVLAAGLLEGAGELDAAERILSGLPGGGCGGGVNLHLAEFWLRQKRELARVLDAFNGACRQEPDNPRWQLRVAQTYLARNWRKQGLELLRRVVGDPRLEAGLRLEAELLLGEG